MSVIARLTPASPVVVYRTPEGRQPAPGSVVMTQGMTGTSWQRHFKDGLWHSSTGQVKTWEQLFQGNQSGVSLLLDVPETPEGPARPVRSRLTFEQTQRVKVTLGYYDITSGAVNYDEVIAHLMGNGYSATASLLAKVKKGYDESVAEVTGAQADA